MALGKLYSRQMSVWYSVVLLLVMSAGLAASGIVYTKHEADQLKSEMDRNAAERQRNLCEVINASLGIEPGRPLPAIPPASTPRGQRIVDALLDLRLKLECP